MKEQQTPRMKELQRKIHQANIVLSIVVPIFLVGAILLHMAGASEGVMQAFGMAAFFSGFPLLLLLDARYERRHGGRGERGDQ